MTDKNAKNIELEDALADCLDALRRGKAIKKEIGRYPQYKDELEKLLEVIPALDAAAEILPRQEFLQNASQRLIAKLPDLPSTPQQVIKAQRPPNKQAGLKTIRAFGVVLILVFFLFAGSLGAAYAANDSEPGNFLYNVDLAVEKMRLNLATHPQTQAALRLQFATERLNEAENLFKKGDLKNSQIALGEYNQQIFALRDLMEQVEGKDRISLCKSVNQELDAHLTTLARISLETSRQTIIVVQKTIALSSAGCDYPSTPTQSVPTMRFTQTIPAASPTQTVPPITSQSMTPTILVLPTTKSPDIERSTPILTEPPPIPTEPPAIPTEPPPIPASPTP